MKSIYYAHSLRIYNTSQERLELKQIAELVPSRRIINPNGAIASIKEAYQFINQSSGVVATEYQNHIGKGVYDEICYALSKRKLGSKAGFGFGVFFQSVGYIHPMSSPVLFPSYKEASRLRFGFKLAGL